MKYEAISRNSAKFPVKKMCEVFGLHVTNYYRWKQYQRKREEKREKELSLVRLIEGVFLESDKTYGYRAIKKALEQKDIELSEYKIRKIMRENGFYPETRKKYKPYRKGKADGKYYRNLIQQNFKAEKRNQVWVGDITYLKTKLGWVYLAAVIDLYNREVIGYAVSKKIDTELVKRALGNAIGRNGVAEGLVFHSDRGSQYASRGYQKMLAEHGIKGSMSKPGCPYDNASMESFFATLKKERIYRREYVTMEEVKADMFRYIELFYNRKRLHSVLGYMSPVDYRLKYDGSKVA